MGDPLNVVYYFRNKYLFKIILKLTFSTSDTFISKHFHCYRIHS